MQLDNGLVQLAKNINQVFSVYELPLISLTVMMTIITDVIY